MPSTTAKHEETGMAFKALGLWPAAGLATSVFVALPALAQGQCDRTDRRTTRPGAWRVAHSLSGLPVATTPAIGNASAALWFPCISVEPL